MAWAEALAGGGTLTGASGVVQVGHVAVSGSVAGASVAVGRAGLWLQIGVQPVSSNAIVSAMSPAYVRGRGRRILYPLLKLGRNQHASRLHIISAAFPLL